VKTKSFLTMSLLFLTVFAGGVGAGNATVSAKSTAQTSAAKQAAPKQAAPKQAAPKQQAAPMSDAAINTAVKEKLGRTPSLKDATLDASTKDGVVTLTGTLKTGGLKGVATNVAKSVKGVKKVDNQITVPPKAGSKSPARSKT
jgi:hyperosmotically inducible protein